MSTSTTPPDGASPARGALLGVDVGEVRVGLAASDPEGLIATPVDTLRRDREHGSDLVRIAEEVRDRGAVGVVVGLPRSLSGEEGLAAGRARLYAKALQRHLEVPVRLWDERLTTVDAHRALRSSGVPGRRQRGVVDQAAAVLILQAALDARRAGRPAGVPLKARKPRTPRSGTR
ncbi:Holliday junction resolvase RuvX [Ornithinimicrobium cerasi]|uniref:Putative pre-16S rRNA nuclease n=1 Tax=Ornithinimicrobium cerasi TaxID=2248773 RepID=A0A285VN49_9MICO|nr:Holliday junction resolvase RuvX [Ornithinimicrobium cerasi]SOC54636.1 putative holliday junction resolvase [Ornithinimicrobium cerasi]